MAFAGNSKPLTELEAASSRDEDRVKSSWEGYKITGAVYPRRKPAELLHLYRAVRFRAVRISGGVRTLGESLDELLTYT